MPGTAPTLAARRSIARTQFWSGQQLHLMSPVDDRVASIRVVTQIGVGDIVAASAMLGMPRHLRAMSIAIASLFG